MILDEILAFRTRQLEREKQAVPLKEWMERAGSMPGARGFLQALCAPGISVIAEVKKASPSKGVICSDFQPQDIARGYEQNGAAALSVLTEEHFFQGSSAVFQTVRETVELPLLRKDFIFDEYQVYEARAQGADAVLLIVAVLKERTRKLLALVRQLGMDAMVEVHDCQELEIALNAGARIIGINNRNLKTFEVTIETTKNLVACIPAGHVVVSESGIRTREDVEELARTGIQAILVGETLMRGGSIPELKGEAE